jgi:hypothetical protein
VWGLRRALATQRPARHYDAPGGQATAFLQALLSQTCLHACCTGHERVHNHTDCAQRGLATVEPHPTSPSVTCCHLPTLPATPLPLCVCLNLFLWLQRCINLINTPPDQTRNTNEACRCDMLADVVCVHCSVAVAGVLSCQGAMLLAHGSTSAAAAAGIRASSSRGDSRCTHVTRRKFHVPVWSLMQSLWVFDRPVLVYLSGFCWGLVAAAKACCWPMWPGHVTRRHV